MAHNCVVGGWESEQWTGSFSRRPTNTDIWANSREVEQSAKAMHRAVHDKQLAPSNS